MSRRQVRLISAGVLVLIAWAGATFAVESDLTNLPSTSRFSCVICHVASQDGISADLNLFGQDYLEAGRTWGLDLANLDSDGDGCTNGSELGDVDANGTLDDGLVAESSNPGNDGDCTSASSDSMTWSQIKDLFNGR